MKYPKIHSLWKRQGWYLEEGKKNNPEYQTGRQSFIEGDYALPEFGNIKRWLVQEKIDGTNIRVSRDLEAEKAQFMSSPKPGIIFNIKVDGRTDEAMVPKNLEAYIKATINYGKWTDVFGSENYNVIIFGEGYGPKIQKGGGNYRSEQGFILFDVRIGSWWLTQEDVKDIADRLGFNYAPIIGVMTEQEIVDYVKSHPLSLCSQTPQVMEGIIARPEQLLLLRNGDPLMMKLKCKEFKKDK